MKKKLSLTLAAVGLIVSLSAIVRSIDVPSVIFHQQLGNDPVVCSTKTYVIDVNNTQTNRLSALVVYSTVVVPTISFTDGQASTAAITVSSNTALSSAAANGTISISSNSILTTKWFSLVVNNTTNYFYENKGWTSCEYFTSSRTAHNFSTATAVSIATMINFSSYSVSASTVADGIVRVVAIQKGTIGNSYGLFSSTPAALIASGTFVGGRNPAILKINGVTFEAGKDFPIALTSSRTAQNISSAVVSNLTLNSIIASSWTIVGSNGVITATSTAVNQSAYTLYTSTNGALALSSTTLTYADGSAIGNFVGGAPTTVNLATEFISTPNALAQGQAVLFSSVAGTSPTPLFSGTTYFVLSPTPQSFQLAFTSTGALAGSPINLSSQTARGGGVFTVAPISYTANYSTSTFKWQVSNDSSTWFDVTGAFSMNFTSATAFDFGNINYRWLRELVTSSSNTPTAHQSYLNGKP